MFHAILGTFIGKIRFALPVPFKYGFEMSAAAIIGFCLMSFVSAIEAVGDVSGISLLSDVDWNRRNMVIFAIALSIGFGLQLEPGAVQHLPETLRILMTSGLLPAAFIAIALNLILPAELADEAADDASGGHSGHGSGSLSQD